MENLITGIRTEHATHRHLLFCDSCGLAHADRQERGERPAAQTPLLPTAAQDGLQPDTRSPPDICGTHSLGSVKLVAGYAHEVDIPLVDIDRDLSGGLCRICVEINPTVLADDFAYFFHGLNDAGLVIDSHNGDEGRVRPNSLLEFFKTNDTILLDGEISDVEALLLQLAAGIEDTFVLLRKRLRSKSRKSSKNNVQSG